MQPPIARLFDLDGRRALVTGASSGLGRHFALTLAAAGAEVAVASRRTEQLRELVADIEAAGGRAQAFALDVTRRQDVCRCLDEVGPLDILVNNAGVSDSRAFLDYDDESWQRILDTNLSGAWIVAQETARRMVAAERGGSLINVTSILASRVAGAVTPYLAAKAGLAQLTRAMALELARYGIRVAGIAPGFIETEMVASMKPEALEKMTAGIPLRRMGKPEEIAHSLAYIIENDYYTGRILELDGGLRL